MKKTVVCVTTLISSLMAGWVSFDGTSEPTPPQLI